MANVSSELSDIAVEVTSVVGTSISVKDLLEASVREPRIWELLNWHIPPGLDFPSIERELEARGKELVECLLRAGGPFARLLRSNAAINLDQLRQAFLSVGPKPDLLGRVIPEPIDTSFLLGMTNVEHFYTCCVSARKALVTNFKQVKTSGYLSRKQVLLVAGHTLDPSLEDCGTEYRVTVRPETREHASRLSGRWMSLLDGNDRPEGDEFLTQEGNTDVLVGNSYAMRSPIPCAGDHGVCRKCYGALSRINHSIHVGIYAVLVISEQVTQRLLSSKHLLKTKTAMIDWPAEFLEVFSVNKAVVESESDLDSVTILAESIEESEEDDSRFATAVSVQSHGSRKPKVIRLPMPLQIDEETWADADERDGALILKPAPGQSIFQITLENSELSATLQSLFALIEKEEHDDYDLLYDSFMKILIETGIQSPSVHAEMIIRALVRDSADQTRRPDFAGDASYVILKLPQAILNSDSITNSLAFERVKEQLTSPRSLQKTASGLFDPLFGGAGPSARRTAS